MTLPFNEMRTAEEETLLSIRKLILLKDAEEEETLLSISKLILPEDKENLDRVIDATRASILSIKSDETLPEEQKNNEIEYLMHDFFLTIRTNYNSKADSDLMGELFQTIRTYYSSKAQHESNFLIRYLAKADHYLKLELELVTDPKIGHLSAPDTPDSNKLRINQDEGLNIAFVQKTDIISADIEFIIAYQILGTLIGMTIGIAIGFALGGIPGAVVGGCLGAIVGDRVAEKLTAPKTETFAFTSPGA